MSLGFSFIIASGLILVHSSRRLSAYLYQATNQTEYLNVANLTGSFIVNHLFSNSTIYEALDIANCKIYTTERSIYEIGYSLEAFAILASVSGGEWQTRWDHLSLVLCCTCV